MSDTTRRVPLIATPAFWVTVIFLIALTLRLVATAMFEGLSSGPNAGAMYDGVEYDAIAVNLVRHGEFAVAPGDPTSFRAPGFPLLLALVYSLFGAPNYLAAHVVFCLIGAALCVATYLTARQVASEVISVGAAALVATYPNLLYYNIHFASEPLFTLLLVACVGLLIRAMRTDRLAMFLASGLALGLAALVRPVAFYFMPFFALVALVAYRRRLGPGIVRIAVMGAALFAVVLPWTLRNYAVHDRYLLLASNGGSTFWGANNRLVLDSVSLRGSWVSTEAMPSEKKPIRQLENEVDRDRAEWDVGKAFVRENPDALPRLAWYKLRALYTPETTTPNAKFNLIVGLSYGIALPFMLVGAVLLARRRGLFSPDVLALAVPVVATTASSLIFYGSARFRSTIEPLLLILAAVAVIALLNRLASRLPDRWTDSPRPAP